MNQAGHHGATPRSVIVVSTGRTATQAIAGWAACNLAGVASWHEPFPSRLLRPLCHMRVAGRLGASDLVRLLRATSARRRKRSQDDVVFFEASPYLRACVDLLPQVFDDPLVLHMVRDPRAYVTSYINHGAFSGAKGILGNLVPYWQLKPEHLDPGCSRRWHEMSHHERICWRWNALNGLIEDGARTLPSNRYLRLRFEDVVDPRQEGLAPLMKALNQYPVSDGYSAVLNMRSNQSRETFYPPAKDWSEEMVSMMQQYCNSRMKTYGYT